MLCEHHGFWVPRTCTTRVVESHETDLLHFSSPDFLDSVRIYKVVLPAWFGGEWYGWLAEDLQKLQQDTGSAVLNVRPYPALILQALLKDFVGVWLTLDDGELSRRRAERLAPRDTDIQWRMNRQRQDDIDLIYKPCFAHVLEADDGLLANLLKLIP